MPLFFAEGSQRLLFQDRGAKHAWSIPSINAFSTLYFPIQTDVSEVPTPRYLYTAPPSTTDSTKAVCFRRQTGFLAANVTTNHVHFLALIRSHNPERLAADHKFRLQKKTLLPRVWEAIKLTFSQRRSISRLIKGHANTNIDNQGAADGKRCQRKWTSATTDEVTRPERMDTRKNHFKTVSVIWKRNLSCTPAACRCETGSSCTTDTSCGHTSLYDISVHKYVSPCPLTFNGARGHVP